MFRMWLVGCCPDNLDSFQEASGEKGINSKNERFILE